MFREKIYPYVLVFFQLGSLAVIFLTGPWLAGTWDGIVVEMAGVVLGIVAIYVAGIHNVNIAPRPKNGGVLITSGPYRQIRHPMYLAQVVAVIPLVLSDFTWFRLAVLLTLVVALLLKMPYEEKGLVRQFGDDYLMYKEQTKKVLPFLY
ncbi:MAG: isoprenylcysteine carboxylmethyltransferase family protein [Bacteroidales bacterium]|nr:isoprenylcysteine carboxylmethyltransferase family protein [Bacteroidales bacterium]